MCLCACLAVRDLDNLFGSADAQAKGRWLPGKMRRAAQILMRYQPRQKQNLLLLIAHFDSDLLIVAVFAADVALHNGSYQGTGVGTRIREVDH